VTPEDRLSAKQLLDSLGIHGRYVLMTGGLTESKGASEAARTAMELASVSAEPLPIISCGPERVRDIDISQARDSGALAYAGRVDPGLHLALLADAACVASFSIREGLPRTLLETMAHRRPFFAPICVPEFEALPHLEGSPQDKALQILNSIDQPAHQAKYDLAQHDPNAVLALLVEHFQDAIQGH